MFLLLHYSPKSTDATEVQRKIKVSTSVLFWPLFTVHHSQLIEYPVFKFRSMIVAYWWYLVDVTSLD